MMLREAVEQWLASLPPGSHIAIDEGGLSLVAVGTPAYLELGGDDGSIFTVQGSHGTLKVDADTGDVLWCDPAGSEYANIARFDVGEWRAAYPEGELSDATIDILDIGYWRKYGDYEPPEKEMRK